MDVRSLGPLAVGSVMWQSPRGGWVQTVVAKATFDLVPGEARLADEQDACADRDRFFEEDRPSSPSPLSEASRSVYVPSDLAPFKPHTDVVVVGHAYAPKEEPVRSLVARVVVGELDKAIEVVQDRTLGLDGELREGARFTKMPLRYERSAGGPDTWNPVGVRHEAVDALGRATLPNIQPPGTIVKTRGDVIEATGFGPLSEAWWSRRERLGRHAKTWQPTSFGDRPLPDDIDPTYFNAAPRDQQLAALRDDAPIALDNLSPEHPRLVTRLPGIRPRAFVEHDHGPADLRMAPDTLWIDTDRGVATVTWRGQVLLDGPHHHGMVYVALERIGSPTTWGDVMRMLERKSAPPSRPPGTEPGLVALPSEVRALPFAPPPAPAPLEATPPPSNAPPMTIGQALVAAGATAEATSTTKKTATPATEDLMTLAGAIGSGKAPPWLAMHAARSAPGGAKSSQVSPFARSVVVPGAGVGGVASDTSVGPVSPVPDTIVAATVPAGSEEIPSAEPASTTVISTPEQRGAIRRALATPRDLDMTLTSGRAVRSGTQPIDPAAVAAAVTVTGAAAGREAIELLWMDGSAPRAEGADAELSRVRRALQQAPSETEAGLRAAFAAAFDPDGGFAPPILRVDGELELVPDDIEVLAVMLAAAGPFVGADPALRELVAAATIATPATPRAVTAALAARLRDPLARAARSLLGDAFEATIEASLAEARRWSRRLVFGGSAVAARIRLASGGEAIPVYVPDEAAALLPIARRVPVSLFVAAHPAQDPAEASPVALRAAALARRITLPV